MGQSKTEYARRRREERESRENSMAVLNESTGMVMITKNACGTDTIFDADGVIYNVTRIYEIAKANPKICGPFPALVTHHLRSYLMTNEHVDQDRARRIPLEKAQEEPLLCVGEKGGSSMILDGQHRALRMCLAGIGEFQSYIVPPKLLPPPVIRTFRHISECSPEIAEQARATTKDELLPGMKEYAEERKMTVEEMNNDDSYIFNIMDDVMRKRRGGG